MPEITATFTYRVPAHTVYEALTEEQHLKNWWTPDAQAEPKLRSEARFEFNPYGDYCVMKLIQLRLDKKVVWYCRDSRMLKTPEWIGTHITFEIGAKKPNETLVAFSHDGWKAVTACFKECTGGWQYFLGESLKAYLETGKGKPFTSSSD